VNAGAARRVSSVRARALACVRTLPRARSPWNSRARSPCLAQRDGDGLLSLADLPAARRSQAAALVFPHHLADLLLARLSRHGALLLSNIGASRTRGLRGLCHLADSWRSLSREQRGARPQLSATLEAGRRRGAQRAPHGGNPDPVKNAGHMPGDRSE